jgi:hypothetical protein
MKLEEFTEDKELYNEDYLRLLTEVRGSQRLSKKIEKLIHKLEEKKIAIPGTDWPDIKKVIDVLHDELLGKIKTVEKDYEKGNINARQVAYKIRKYRRRALQVKRVLQDKKILNKTDWQFLVYAGLGLMWLPSAITSGPDFIKLFGLNAPSA